jgi:hypothetical protein
MLAQLPQQLHYTRTELLIGLFALWLISRIGAKLLLQPDTQQPFGASTVRVLLLAGMMTTVCVRVPLQAHHGVWIGLAAATSHAVAPTPNDRARPPWALLGIVFAISMWGANYVRLEDKSDSRNYADTISKTIAEGDLPEAFRECALYESLRHAEPRMWYLRALIALRARQAEVAAAAFSQITPSIEEGDSVLPSPYGHERDAFLEEFQEAFPTGDGIGIELAWLQLLAANEQYGAVDRRLREFAGSPSSSSAVDVAPFRKTLSRLLSVGANEELPLAPLTAEEYLALFEELDARILHADSSIPRERLPIVVSIVHGYDAAHAALFSPEDTAHATVKSGYGMRPASRGQYVYTVRMSTDAPGSLPAFRVEIGPPMGFTTFRLLPGGGVETSAERVRVPYGNRVFAPTIVVLIP